MKARIQSLVATLGRSLTAVVGAADVKIYGLIALLVLGPLLLPGYILTLDMVFTPELRLPELVSSSYLFRALLYTLDLALPSELIQKVLLFIILFMAGLGMHRLMAQLIKPARNYFSAAKPEDSKAVYQDGLTDLHVRPPVHHTVLYFAGLLYMINPFTYSRFVTGQYAVLFGYALLPWLLRALFTFISRPNYRTALAVTGWSLAISIVSIHTIAIAAIPAVLIIGLQLWRLHRGSVAVRRLVAYTALIGAIWLIASSYWLVPALTGKGPQAATISSFTIADRQAFATTGGDAIGRLGNVLGMQGFWAEGRLLVDMPQYTIPQWLWISAIVLLIILVGVGLSACWRNGRRGVAIVFGLSIMLGAILGSGFGGNWLAEHVPFYAGYREPHKFTGLVVLGYSVLAMFGAAAIGQRLHQAQPKQWKPGSQTRAKIGYVSVSVLLLALPLLMTPNMLWAATGQLRSAPYPDGWYTVNRLLNQAAADNPADFQALVLPWHLYLHMDFVGRVTANPAINFFDQPVISSNDPELLGAARSIANRHIQTGAKVQQSQQQVEAMLEQPSDFSRQLANLDIEYVILTKNSDYRRYDYLTNQTGLDRIYNDEDISLYRNRSYTN